MQALKLFLTKARKMFTIEFQTLDTPAGQGYEGDYQNQDDFPEDQKHFILNAQTVSLSEIQSFPGELSSLEFRLAQHEAAHAPSPSIGSVADLAVAQGVKPLADLNALGGFWPDDEGVEDFLAAARRWRGP